MSSNSRAGKLIEIVVFVDPRTMLKTAPPPPEVMKALTSEPPSGKSAKGSTAGKARAKKALASKSPAAKSAGESTAKQSAGEDGTRS